jgi:nicotinate-nucleotide--dimethylbenzimidazole phosphoribosyltransferase
MRIDFSELNAKIPVPDLEAAAAVKARWDNIAKPVGSLGDLETLIMQIAAITGMPDVRIDRRVCLVMCADNGVTAQGVASTPPEISVVMSDVIAEGRSAVGLMGKIANCDIRAYDVGLFSPGQSPQLIDVHVARGSRDLSLEPAMTREEACRAICVGIDAVRNAKEDGYQIVLTGEMGIGNTTTTAAVASALLGQQVELMTGRGVGLTDAGLEKKMDAIRKGLRRVSVDDPLGIIAEVGGFDIAALAGVVIGGALFSVPVIIDGVIAGVSALIASKLCPASSEVVLASHVSAEPAAREILAALGKKAVIDGNLRLGEGTGATLLLLLLDSALHVYRNLLTYSEIGM